MKYIESITLRELNREFGRMEKRIKSLENKTEVVLRSSPDTNPKRNSMWLDDATGKLHVWSGTTWQTWTKD